MNTYISILRGINVSGQRMIKMDVLRQLYTDLGFAQVQTYIQSGNVVFQCADEAAKTLEQTIAESVFQKFGFQVPVLVKELGELKQIIHNNPFLKNPSKDAAHLHVTFLSDVPNNDLYLKLREGKYQADEIELIGNTVYLYCPNGYGNTKLSNSFLESKLKVAATTRNWRTTNELLSIADRTANLQGFRNG